jgi:hypothetical protein
MDCPDSCAGEHRDSGFGDHRHVERHAIALDHAMCLQDVGKAAGFGMQFGIAQPAALGRVVAFPDDRRRVAPLGQMPIQAI